MVKVRIPTDRPAGSPLAARYGRSSSYGKPPHEEIEDPDPWAPRPSRDVEPPPPVDLTKIVRDGVAKAVQQHQKDLMWRRVEDAMRRVVDASSRQPTRLVAKGAAGTAVLQPVKAEAERRFVLGVAWAVDTPSRRGLDGFKDVAAPEAVERAAHAWMLKSGRIGLFHGDMLGGSADEGHARIVESSIYRGPNWSTIDAFGNRVLIKAGDWLMGAILDEKAWQLAKAGRLTGWSAQGRAVRKPLSPARRAQIGRR